MNKNKKSKVVLFSVIGLAAVSIGTVGFATWVVGVQKTETSLTVNALVDDTTNSSLYLDAVASTESVKIAEKVAYPGSGTKQPYDVITTVTESNPSDSITVDENALNFSFTKLQFSIGDAAKMPKKLKIELLNGVDENVANKVTESGTTYRTANDYTYLDINTKKISIDDFIPSSTGSVSKWTYTAAEVEMFKWGTFFGGDSPCTYYNDLYKADPQKLTDSDADIDQVYSELTALQNAFMYTKDSQLKPGTIVLQADLVVTPKSA